MTTLWQTAFDIIFVVCDSRTLLTVQVNYLVNSSDLDRQAAEHAVLNWPLLSLGLVVMSFLIQNYSSLSSLFFPQIPRATFVRFLNTYIITCLDVCIPPFMKKLKNLNTIIPYCYSLHCCLTLSSERIFKLFIQLRRHILDFIKSYGWSK